MHRSRFGSVLALSLFCVACQNPAADKPVAQVSEAQPEAAPPAAAPAAPAAPDTALTTAPGVAPGAAPANASQPDQPVVPGGVERLEIVPASSKIEFTGSKVTGSHNGGFHQFKGAIDLAGGKPEASRVIIDIDTASIWADNEKLTGHLKTNEFFDVATFPKATFTSTKIEPRADTPNGYTVTGNLDLHGQKKSITFPATIATEPKAVTVKAEFVISRKDFGIVYPGKPNDLIRDEVVIRLDINTLRS